MPSANSAKPFKSLKAAMRRRPRSGSLLSVICHGHDCISRRRHAPKRAAKRGRFFSAWLRIRLAGPAGRAGFLAPSLQSRPDPGEGTEFCATANEDGDLALQRIGFVGGLAHVFDVLEFAFQDLP